eukprot:CAMPEP_0174820484 /NCGR_PEP_ID=MMETSP1107-20130205/4365_1 /TAXON_ID=36770 /ORGANISM="Paraphysomonas vestita, Strain GFlagA" /LENGTH=474 /DNA_ID=CAMNT_0016035945 /DNA_START=93 /DNA_END=1517 /DNA_ORIENTATION=+
MSTWTIDEVLALTTQKGGGNEIALKTWLANAPPIGGRYNGGSRPKSGDKIEIYKQFIVDCYEKRLFYSELSPDALQSSSSPTSNSTSPASVASSSQKTSPRSTISPTPQQQSQSQPQASFDFFGDNSSSFPSNSNSGFDAFETSFTSNPNPPVSNSNQGFGFDAFESSSSTSGFSFMNTSSSSSLPQPPTTQQQQSSNFGFNDFSNFTSSQQSNSFAQQPLSPPVPAFHSSKTAPVATHSAFDFDPFSPAVKPTRSSSDNVPIGFNQPNSPITPSSSFTDPFGSDILSFQTVTPTNNSMQSGYSTSFSSSSSMSSTTTLTPSNSAMNNNNRAAMAISSIGMPPRGPINNNNNNINNGGIYSQRGPAPSSGNMNSFDFVGSAMQSELGRGSSSGTAMRSSPMTQPQSSPMNSTMRSSPMGMGMGMGMGGNGMSAMGGGMQSPMNANNGFNISSMGGNSMQPRGPPQNNYQFPSNW